MRYNSAPNHTGGYQRAMNNDYADVQNPDSDYAQSQDAPSPYANKGGTKQPKQTGTKGKKPPNGELTILASYTWDPAIDGKTEVEYLLSHKWHPSTLDYTEITGITPTTCPADFSALLGMINECAKQSIKRLNFWTHSDAKKIGITGYLDSTGVFFTTYISETDIANHATTDYTYTYNKHEFVLADVRDRFASDAIFVIYGCDTAFDPTKLLGSLRDLLQVTVIGFKKAMVFCPPTQGLDATSFNRKGEKVGIDKTGFSCATDSTRNWRALIGDANAVRVPK